MEIRDADSAEGLSNCVVSVFPGVSNGDIAQITCTATHYASFRNKFCIYYRYSRFAGHSVVGAFVKALSCMLSGKIDIRIGSDTSVFSVLRLFNNDVGDGQLVGVINLLSALLFGIKIVCYNRQRDNKQLLNVYGGRRVVGGDGFIINAGVTIGDIRNNIGVGWGGGFWRMRQSEHDLQCTVNALRVMLHNKNIRLVIDDYPTRDGGREQVASVACAKDDVFAAVCKKSGAYQREVLTGVSNDERYESKRIIFDYARTDSSENLLEKFKAMYYSEKAGDELISAERVDENTYVLVINTMEKVNDIVKKVKLTLTIYVDSVDPS
jgi:hypothetical protein